MRPIEESCYWLAQRPRRAPTSLEGPAGADVAIVGAGLTGLWTAIHLKALDPSAEVVVLEQREAAHGASGRNAGMLSETVDHSHGLGRPARSRRRRSWGSTLSGCSTAKRSAAS